MSRAGLALLVALELLVVLPLPVTLPLFAGAEAAESWPVLWLLAGGFLAVCWLVGTRSVPLALLLGWAGARTLAAGLPLRSTLLLAEVVAVLTAYLVAAALPAGADRWLLVGLALAALLTAWVGLEQVLGVGWTLDGLTAATGAVLAPRGWSARPQDTPLAGEHGVQQRSGLLVRGTVVGQPQAFLGHPNHFGVFLALALPAVLWVVAGRAMGVTPSSPVPVSATGNEWTWRSWLGWAVGGGLLVMVVLSRSRTAVIALGLLAGLWIWPRIGLWVRLAFVPVGAGLATGIVEAVASGEANLGFRLRAWRLGWATALRAPWAGWGLGTWRFWALDPRGPIAAYIGARDAGWWREAFNEPLQLFFELGGVGLALGLVCLGQLALDAGRGWRAGGAGRPWAGTATVGLVALWTTAVFHYPPLMLPVLVAAARLRR